MVRLRWVVLLTALAACSRTPGPPPLGDVDASTMIQTGGGTPCGFAPAIAFTLPTAPGVTGRAFMKTTGEMACGNATFRWSLRDMDGDLRPDLVVSSACQDASVGVDVWLVYTNGPTGFATTPVRFALPLLPSCATSAVEDVDGDRKPDLVITSTCADASVGTSRWLIYRNADTGFEVNPTSFALPPNVPLATFATLDNETADCGKLRPAYRFFDLTGDLKPDLVVTVACDDVSIGIAAWRVHGGNGAGVAMSPARFNLPATPLSSYPSASSADITCGTPERARYAVFDFDGDLEPDIVATKSCVYPSVGDTQWAVYPNGGSSFATAPNLVLLPRPIGTPTGGAFDAFASASACGSSNFSHTLADVDGDLRLDVVVTRTCNDASVGTTRWIAYRNKGMAFDLAGVSYAIPRGLGPGPIDLVANLTCSGGMQSAFDGVSLLGVPLDLVETASCSDATVGSTRWLVYKPACP